MNALSDPKRTQIPQKFSISYTQMDEEVLKISTSLPRYFYVHIMRRQSYFPPEGFRKS